jgi:hypothetical protein
LIEDPRPWAFTRAELTAGLRRHTGDPSMRIIELEEREITQRRPAIGRLRGLEVVAEGTTGKHNFTLVIKEPQGSTRAGTAGAGLREVSVYLVLGDHLPVRIPTLIAAHPKGDWLVIDQLPPGRLPEKWQAADYLLAGSLREDRELIRAIHTIIDHIDTVTHHLRELPMTLLHGDFWPGNIHVHQNGSLTVFDWEMTAIGPSILDLLGFIQTSTWWFDPLPIDSQEITEHYRQRLVQSGAHTWKDKDWEVDWDYAIMWTFFSSWVDLLARIPKSILAARLPGLQNVLFNPVKAAIKRQLS